MAFRPIIIRYTIFDLRPFIVSVNPYSFEPDGGCNVSIHSYVTRVKWSIDRLGPAEFAGSAIIKNKQRNVIRRLAVDDHG
jgi:hypothetical protein